jgi:chromosome segregation ATPase
MADPIAELQNRCRDLEERLRWASEKLRERSERLYDLERQYATEHFELAESMRKLKIERLRNAGALADRDLILQRAKDLQLRIAQLKGRLRNYEEVDDLLFDRAPIVAEDVS